MIHNRGLIFGAVLLFGGVLVAGDGVGHHHGHGDHHAGGHHAAAGHHHDPAHAAPAPVVAHHPAAPVAHHPAPVAHAHAPVTHHAPAAPFAFVPQFFGRFMNRIRSFVHFNRRTVDDFPLTQTQALTALLIAALIILALDLAITGGLQLSFTNSLFGGRSYEVVKESVEDVARQFYNSIDGVELAMDLMRIEERECRMKAVCKAEQMLGVHPLARLAISNINDKIDGLAKYVEAIDAGLNGDDCDLMYDKCSQYLGF